MAGKAARREVTGRVVFACLLAFFVVVTAVNIVMIRIAVSTFGGVETENAYQAGLAFTHEIAAADTQETLHWNVRGNLKQEPAGTVIQVTASDANGAPLADVQATGRLLHPADRRADHMVPLSPVQPGVFAGRTQAVAGQWVLLIELSRGGATLFRSRNRVFVR